MAKKNSNLLKRVLHRIGDKALSIHSTCELLFEKALVPGFKFVFEKVKWHNLLVFLFLHFSCGCIICFLCSYSIFVYALVFSSLSSITFVSVLAEKEFIEKSNLIQADILGHSANYNHNTEIAALLASANKQWSITGGLLLKATRSVFFFGVIGCLLLKNRPPVGVFFLFLSVYMVTVEFSMIGYHQYQALLRFIRKLTEKYEPSKKVINWMTKEQISWIVKLAELYDFMSAAFFVLGLLFTIACCGFCFLPAFGVLSGSSTSITILLFILWGKILYELLAKYVFQLFIGKKDLSTLANRIKDSHLDQVRITFGNTLRTPKDYTGYNLYLQLSSLKILPAKNSVTSIIRGVCSAASFIVTVSSLHTIFQTLQTKLV